MKPKYLEFCGLNSFSSPAKIDFDRLLKSGIFGIFGDTGSGKTTILDAIVFALYGRVERARGGVGADIINYNCDKAYVKFEFESVDDSGRTIYRIEREIRRKNSLQKAELLKIKDVTVTPLADGKVSAVNALVQDIIGLNFEDFKKCIALPQGEFSQFVKAEKSERLKLVSRLFDLEEYGEKLNFKVRDRVNACNEKLNFYKGKLAAYDDVSKESLNEINKKIDYLTAESKGIEKKYAELESRYNFLKSAYDRNLQLKIIEKSLSALLEVADEVEEKRRVILKYPIAQEASEKNIAILKNSEKLLLIRAKIVEIERLEKDARVELDRLSSEILQKDYEKDLAELREKLIHAEYLKLDGEQLSGKKSELKYLEYDKDGLEKKVKTLEQDIRAIDEKKILFSKKKQGLANPESVLKQKYGGSLLKEEYGQSLEYFKEIQKILKEEFADGSKLYLRAAQEISERISYYSSLLSKIDFSCSPREAFEEYKNLRSELDKLVEAEYNLELYKSDKENQLNAAKEKLSDIFVKSQKLNADISNIEKKISEVMGACDYFSFVKKLQEKISLLETERNNFLESIDKNKKVITESAVELKGLFETEKLYSENLSSLNNSLSEILKANSFISINDVNALLEKYPDVESLKNEVEKYDTERISLEAKQKAYSDGNVAVTEEELNAAENEYRLIGDCKQNVFSELKLFTTQYKNDEKRLNEKLDNESEMKFYKDKLELLEKLRMLIKGNQFMEFIASEYLSDISTAASETLLKLTGGRYFIRYNQGFFVGDNYNGGEHRAVATLSGGETFLVSLSLALALSSAIYAKSLKPIEFFFLDEGFGTLDEKLIDTVMDSLEKLKNTNFSIGLISHVEELKHRIDNKITVIGATEGESSKIQINY